MIGIQSTGTWVDQSPGPSREDGVVLLLQVSQVRLMLNRSRARIYEMCATGELESFRDGRSILIPRDAVDAWIIKKRRQGRR